MSKICFINPPFESFMERLDAPLNLMYLAAVAEQEGWEASIIDMEKITDPLPQADVYGVTATSPQWFDAAQVSNRLAKEFPYSLTIAGGCHISAVPKDLEKTNFKMAIVGEAEKALTSILRFHNIPSLFAKIFHGSPVKNLAEIPFPARHLIDWTKYKRGIYWGKELLRPATAMITSRGCPFNCVFCGSQIIFGKKVRFRSVANVLDEIQHVITTMEYKGINFHDDTFCFNRNRTMNICKSLIGLDVIWRCLSRVDTIDRKLVNLMGLAGCREIILGVESGSQKILDRLRKKTTVKQNLTAMRLVKDQPDVQLKVGVIVGSPGETWETIKQTKNMLKKYPPDFWNISVFTPFPGSFAWRHPEKLGLKILTRDLQQYRTVGKDFKGNVVIETEEMSKDDIEQARDELVDLCLSFG